MKNFLLIYVLFFYQIVIYGQKIAIIKETNEEVVLNDDGTWNYLLGKPEKLENKDTLLYLKPKLANYLLKSERIKYGVWINDKEWTFSKSKDEMSPVEYNFRLKGQDAYGMIISERIETSMESLLEVAFQNAQSIASDAKIVNKEVRKVNGSIIHFVEMHCTIQGIKFIYFGYYFTNENGTIQFLAFTSDKLLERYKKKMENLINGLVITK